MSEPNPPTQQPAPLFSKEWEEENNQWARFGPLLIAVVVFGVAIGAAMFYPRYIRNKGDPHEWVRPLLSEIQSNFTYNATNFPPEQKSRIEEQARHVAGRANHHFQVLQYYYSNYYVSLLLGSVYGGLAALSLVLLTKAGWREGGRCLASFFLTTSVCTTFFFTFPTWCKMDENATKNKALYVRYVGLLNDARTFTAIGDYAQDPQSTNTMSITNFILRMDSEMKKANDIAVAFDATKGPIYNLSTDKPPK